jgi:hypothetical protein
MPTTSRFPTDLRLRRFASRLRLLASTRPRLLPFLPVLGRSVLGSGQGVEPLPSVAPPVRSARIAARAVHDLVVFAVIRNGIGNGYPFIEAFGSWLGRADRIVVLDGESDDGTREALERLAAIDPSVVVESAPWPDVATGGAAIAEMTNRALELARDGARRLMYVQADEIYTDEQRDLVVAQPPGGTLEFAGCVNFWNSFDTVLENEFPMRYLRLFPADAAAHSIADGFSFELGDATVTPTGELYLHYGWCFPVNILRKHVSHGRLYRDHPGYRLRGALAQLMLEQRRYDRRLLDALAPQYRPVPFRGEHPACMRHVVTQTAYDPSVGLGLLESGIRW